MFATVLRRPNRSFFLVLAAIPLSCGPEALPTLDDQVRAYVAPIADAGLLSEAGPPAQGAQSVRQVESEIVQPGAGTHGFSGRRCPARGSPLLIGQREAAGG